MTFQGEQFNDKEKNVSIAMSFGGEDIEWDSFVLGTADGHHEQTSLWAMVKEVYGWKPIRVIAREGDKIQGGVQALLRPIGKWGSVAYVSRGPVICKDKDNLYDLILGRLHRKLSESGVVYCAVVPSYFGHHYESYLCKLGYSSLPPIIPPTGIMTATSVLDLNQDFEEILRRMRRKTKQNIKNGFRAGISVREGNAEEIPTFQKLMWVLCQRRGTPPSPPQKDFFENLWHFFSPKGLVKLFLAEYNGSIISAIIAFAYGNAVKIWKIGWSGEHPNLHPNKVLCWEIIKWAKERGFRLFDFVYINPTVARHLTLGDCSDDTGMEGMTFFKLGFGGNVTLLPQPYWYCFNPLLRLFVRAGGDRILQTGSPLARIVSSFSKNIGN